MSVESTILRELTQEVKLPVEDPPSVRGGSGLTFPPLCVSPKAEFRSFAAPISDGFERIRWVSDDPVNRGVGDHCNLAAKLPRRLAHGRVR